MKNRDFGKRQTKILLGAAAVVVAALVAGIVVWLTSGDDKVAPVPTSPVLTGPQPTHGEYQRLYLNAVVGKTKRSVLDQWPKPPYQTFISGHNKCYEWFDKPVALYTLCFKGGALTDKAIG